LTATGSNKPEKVCPTCKGTGLIQPKSILLRWVTKEKTVCDECGGSGKVEADD
jgi:DnaJ-class molecular chaperone